MNIWKTPQVENVFVRPKSAMGDGYSLYYGTVRCITRKKEMGRASEVEFWRGKKRGSYGARENMG